MTRTFQVSAFTGKQDVIARPLVFNSWDEFRAKLSNPSVRQQKDGPLISPATFDPQKRDSKNVKSLAFLGFDIDHSADKIQVIEGMKRLNCEALIHTTHSHRRITDTNPNAEARFRVVVPLSRDVSPEEYRNLLAYVKMQAGLPFDEAPKSVAQMFYLPAIVSAGMPFDVCDLHGEMLDPDRIPAIDTAPTNRAAQVIPSAINNGSRNDTLFRAACSLRVKGYSDEAVLAAIQAENAAKCSPALSNGEVQMVVESSARYKPHLNSLNSLISLNSQPERSRKKPSLHPDALYGLAGDAVKTIAPYTEASVVAMLIQLLAAFGILVGRSPYFSFGRSRQYLKVNIVLVGPSGTGRKGTSWGEVHSLMERVYDGFREIVVSGLSSGEGLIHHVRDAIYKPTALKEKGRITGYQKELVDEGVIDKRRIVIESELSRTLKAAGREGSILSEVIRDAYDGGDLRVMTKNELKATGTHLSLIGHITPFELLREMDDTAKANGWGNRICWMWTERSQTLPLGGEILDFELNGIVSRLAEAHQFARSVGEMKRTALADELWCEVYGPLSSGYTGLMEALTSRATTHVTRLACIYALLDDSDVVDYDHLKAALALWQYAEDSARYIFGSAVGDRVSDTILAALEESDGLTRTDLNNVLGRHAKAETILAALDRLEKLGRIQSKKVPTEGAPKTIFCLTDRELSEISEMSPAVAEVGTRITSI